MAFLAQVNERQHHAGNVRMEVAQDLHRVTPNPGVALGGAHELGFSPAGLTCRLRAPAT